ncbi:hypothetical protein Ocin01_13416 [Orchesella cincta]|uniref:Uncharacterized protein n=1 Tax=Orchesella cincta TaxID=48709 RepID=A0A1D2MJM7_ORCCI|nr:hypothetical protein Ocin01_13416 [Orchesella cincta]
MIIVTLNLVTNWFYRNHPPKLSQDGVWDHIFSANVKNTLRNLDACIFAAYHDTPFLHRLERPLRNHTKTPITGRKKRSLPALTLDEAGLEEGGWCFQSKLNLLKTVEAYVNYNCPDTTKPLEEVMRRIEEMDAPILIEFPTPDPTTGATG